MAKPGQAKGPGLRSVITPAKQLHCSEFPEELPRKFSLRQASPSGQPSMTVGLWAHADPGEPSHGPNACEHVRTCAQPYPSDSGGNKCDGVCGSRRFHKAEGRSSSHGSAVLVTAVLQFPM